LWWGYIPEISAMHLENFEGFIGREAGKLLSLTFFFPFEKQKRWLYVVERGILVCETIT